MYNEGVFWKTTQRHKETRRRGPQFVCWFGLRDQRDTKISNVKQHDQRTPTARFWYCFLPFCFLLCSLCLFSFLTAAAAEARPGAAKDTPSTLRLRKRTNASHPSPSKNYRRPNNNNGNSNTQPHPMHPFRPQTQFISI